MNFTRSDRIAVQLRKEIAVLVHQAVRDHALPSVSVSDVEVTRDLDLAKVFVTTLVSEAGDKIDLFVFHQANMRINQYVANTLGIPDEKLIHNIHKYGNTTAATIPLLWDEAVRTGRIVPGDLVLMVAFGAGMTWGATLVRA